MRRGAVDVLGAAVDDVSGQTGEQFTTDAQKLVDNLRAQVEDECQPAGRNDLLEHD